MRIATRKDLPESAIKRGYSNFAGLGKMSIQMLSRCGLSVFVVALISGCTVTGTEDSDPGNKCKWNRSSCMHEGSYEPGERAYAEQEAKRLNQAALKRLRRSAGK